MIKSKVEVFTSNESSGAKQFFSHEACQTHELECLHGSSSAGGNLIEFILGNQAAILEILKPARKPRAVKPKPAKEVKAKSKTLAIA